MDWQLQLNSAKTHKPSSTNSKVLLAKANSLMGTHPKGMNMNFLCSDRKARAPQLMRALAIVCASASVIAGCSRKPSVAADQPVPVQLRAPHRLNQPVSVSASGSVEANVTALTAFQVGGRVARVYTEEGQFVKQGQVLAELDCSDYRNAFEAAAGQATAAEATALQAKNGVRAQELEQARIDFDRAQDEYQRQQIPLRSSKPSGQRLPQDRSGLPGLAAALRHGSRRCAQSRRSKPRRGRRMLPMAS